MTAQLKPVVSLGTDAMGRQWYRVECATCIYGAIEGRDQDALLGNRQCLSCETASTAGTRTVIIPARDMHEGYWSASITLKWVCPECGGPRGEPRDGLSFDGSRRLFVHQWDNPCGHIDYYWKVREEAGFANR